MAQLNCPTCYHHNMWPDQWSQMDSGSNVSLNVAQGYPVNPMWMGTWHGPPPSAMGMYPYPMGVPMGHMHPSRPPSPAHSVKSRKSHSSKKSRRRRDSDSDDDLEDRRSIFSHTERGERKQARARTRDTSSMPRELHRRATIDHIERNFPGRTHHSIRASSSNDSDDEMQSGSQKETEGPEDQMEPAKLPEKREALPSIPESSWECEHCTFVNEAGTRVCTVCCKTPTSAAAARPPRTADMSPQNLPRNVHEKPNELKRVKRTRSKEDYKDFAETESVLNKLGKLIVSNEKPDVKSAKPADRKEGRTNRKISFWPGTKFTALQK